MSDIKSENKDFQHMLGQIAKNQQIVEDIAKKINGAPALNGGFDRMLVIVEHIKQKQEETSKKLDQIHEDLYDPDDGLHARVKIVEAFSDESAKKAVDRVVTDEKALAALNETLKKLAEKDEDLLRKSETTIKLKKIAGDDLEKLESMIRMKSMWLNIWSKAVLLLGGGILAAVGKTFWEILSR